jgi:phosphoglucomutase
MISPLAGKKAPKEILENIPELISAYYEYIPDITKDSQKVIFGTSGHRGNPYKKSFNETHILAIAQAISDYRKSHGINGPLFIGIDTHALSIPARNTALRVFLANDIETIIDSNPYTPTPVISHTILSYNKKFSDTADGVVITPSHNPPSDGGFKYNPPNGGAAESSITKWIEKRANEIIQNNFKDLKTLTLEEALKKVKKQDFITPYVLDLKQIVDIEAIKKSGLKIGVDPLGGSSLGVYKKINEIYDLNLIITNDTIDPTFSFMSVDHDGKIRMDCSSPYAMANLLKLKNDFDIAFGNDADSDRHGIVTPNAGLMNPNHYLSVAVWYLFKHRKWENKKIGKTIVTTSMIDKIADKLQKEIYETPVGFKYFAEGLYEKWLGFGGEESAGASFLTFEGDNFSTDKDGIIMNLLACEIKAKIKDPALIYEDLENEFGKFFYKRIDIPVTFEQKEIFKTSLEKIQPSVFAGEKVINILTKAPGNGADIGGVKIITPNSWCAIRPSGTENILKIYLESNVSESHLQEMEKDAKKLIF